MVEPFGWLSVLWKAWGNIYCLYTFY